MQTLKCDPDAFADTIVNRVRVVDWRHPCPIPATHCRPLGVHELQTVYWPGNHPVINKYAADMVCPAVETTTLIVFPPDITHIEAHAFSAYHRLHTVVFQCTTNVYQLTIDPLAFDGCPIHTVCAPSILDVECASIQARPRASQPVSQSDAIVFGIHGRAPDYHDVSSGSRCGQTFYWPRAHPIITRDIVLALHVNAYDYRRIMFPANVTEIRAHAFDTLILLQRVVFSGKNRAQIRSIDPTAFAKCPIQYIHMDQKIRHQWPSVTPHTDA